jgi:putative transposase
MSAGGYKIDNKQGIYFVTFAVVEWIDVFSRKEYRDILLESLRYCQEYKGLQIYAWCIMTNHLHLVVATANNETSNVLRDFKKFTAKKLIRAIRENPAESRKNWMLAIFKSKGASNSRNSRYQFWRQDNQPKELFSEGSTQQKLDYIHNNPVAAGIVEKAEDYLYSSAKDYHEGCNVGLLTIEFLD